MTDQTWYRAMVRVVTPAYAYWNKLGEWHAHHEDAMADLLAYQESTRCPAQTRIDRRYGATA